MPLLAEPVDFVPSERHEEGPPSATAARVSVPVSRGLRWAELFGVGLVLGGSALLNLIGLNQEGFGNTYYAAAVWSMLQNWHAFLFAAFDAVGFVSVDKPPLGLWLQVLSARVFGFNGPALLVPQAICGVLSV
ncbi:MAG TPA: hypothetical protein VK898_20620, partial [Chloroflexota bacterium]|nr:hypothetical protein [Chloroflexota bacterium]